MANALAGAFQTCMDYFSGAVFAYFRREDRSTVCREWM